MLIGRAMWRSGCVPKLGAAWMKVGTDISRYNYASRKTETLKTSGPVDGIFKAVCILEHADIASPQPWYKFLFAFAFLSERIQRGTVRSSTASFS